MVYCILLVNLARIVFRSMYVLQDLSARTICDARNHLKIQRKIFNEFHEKNVIKIFDILDFSGKMVILNIKSVLGISIKIIIPKVIGQIDKGWIIE